MDKEKYFREWYENPIRFFNNSIEDSQDIAHAAFIEGILWKVLDLHTIKEEEKKCCDCGEKGEFYTGVRCTNKKCDNYFHL